MKEYFGKIIDVHTHIFPEKIAEKATAAIGTFYDLAMATVGYRNLLVEQMDKNGIQRCFIHSTATTARQVTAINDFLIETMKNDSNRFTAFGTIHIDMENPLDEVDRIRNNGITGIKFHNDFQQFAVDDPRLYPIYEKAQAEKIPLMFHAGDKRYNFTNPDKFVKIAKLFPNLIAIAAHFGAYSEWDKIDEEYLNTNLWFDTSSALFALSVDEARKIISKHGVDKFLFGSDFPMWLAENEYKNIENLKLDTESLEKIMFKNANRFLEEIKR